MENEHQMSLKRWIEEKSSMEQKIDSLSFDNQILKNDILTLREKYKQSESIIDQKTNEYETLRQQHTISESECDELREKLSQCQDREHDYADKITKLKLSNLENVRSYEQKIEQSKQSIQNHYISQIKDLQSDIELKEMEFNIKLASLESDLATASRQNEEKTKALDDERAEASALRLRLQLLENQMIALRQKMQDHKQESVFGVDPILATSTSSSAFGLLNDERRYRSPTRDDVQHMKEGNRRTSVTDDSILSGRHSPAFSEDMGPLSLPRMSPLDSFNDHMDAPWMKGSRDAFDRSNENIGAQNVNVKSDQVARENESLKRIIREVSATGPTL